MPVPHQAIFRGWMPFLPPNQQCQSTEGTALKYKIKIIAVKKPEICISEHPYDTCLTKIYCKAV